MSELVSLIIVGVVSISAILIGVGLDLKSLPDPPTDRIAKRMWHVVHTQSRGR
jgi:hypothetical protein